MLWYLLHHWQCVIDYDQYFVFCMSRPVGHMVKLPVELSEQVNTVGRIILVVPTTDGEEPWGRKLSRAILGSQHLTCWGRCLEGFTGTLLVSLGRGG